MANERLEKAKLENERLAQALKARPTTVSQKESALQKEVDKCMVRSSCACGVWSLVTHLDAEYPEMFDLPDQYAEYCHHEVLAQYVCSSGIRLPEDDTDFRCALVAFCKQCVDSRIATRQRKCPACNLPFSVSDVQQVYFQ